MEHDKQLTTRDVVNQGLSTSLNEIGELDRFLSEVAREKIAEHFNGNKQAFRDVEQIQQNKLKSVTSIAKLAIRTEEVLSRREMMDFIRLFVAAYIEAEERAIINDETGFFEGRIDDRAEREAFFTTLVEARLKGFDDLYEIYIEKIREARRSGLNADDPALRQDDDNQTDWSGLAPALPKYDHKRKEFK